MDHYASNFTVLELTETLMFIPKIIQQLIRIIVKTALYIIECSIYTEAG